MRNLPQRLHLKNGSYYRVKGNVWTLLSRNRDQALALHAAIETGQQPEPVIERHKSMIRAFLSARKNATVRSIPFLITKAEFNQIVVRCGRCCEVTRIPFDLRSHGSKRRRPYAPSLDRIDSALSYTADNCRLVCVAANMALGEWGINVATRVARGLVRFSEGEKLRETTGRLEKVGKILS